MNDEEQRGRNEEENLAPENMLHLGVWPRIQYEERSKQSSLHCRYKSPDGVCAECVSQQGRDRHSLKVSTNGQRQRANVILSRRPLSMVRRTRGAYNNLTKRPSPATICYCWSFWFSLRDDQLHQLDDERRGHSETLGRRPTAVSLLPATPQDTVQRQPRSEERRIPDEDCETGFGTPFITHPMRAKFFFRTLSQARHSL